MSATYDLHIDSGATYERDFLWQTGSPSASVNLTGYSARAQLRDKARSLLVDLAVGTGLTLNSPTGNVHLVLTAAQTLSLMNGVQFSSNQEVIVGSWDLKLTAGDGTVTRLLMGNILCSAEVTV